MRVRKTKTDCSYGPETPATDTRQLDSPYAMAWEAIDGGRRVGCIRIDDTGEGVTPFYSWVSRSFRRQGVGTKLYEHAARGACRRFGQPLTSALKLSPESHSFWEKQYRRGNADCEVRRSRSCVAYALRCPAPESLAGRRRR